ncbi:replication initiation protein [Rhizobium terrae]|uniref:replication initiation protein n=1 Tax=Rhizobium terrae TaxID=2171756 RepID=UPI000E3C0021|nr:replication initiation protein [Rhizobium terrae]
MRNTFHRRPADKAPITGADRSGIQGDLSAVLDKTRIEKEDPRAERPLVMIRSLRYVGETEGATPAAAMSAKSHALYEYLMASARTQIAKTEDHVVPFAAALAYLDTPRADRIREYVESINGTFVAYDFTDEDGSRRAANRIQLLQCEDVTRPSGTRVIEYRMHPSVRKVILAATQYAHLEVAAFARFRCKYSARLYPKLAYVAGLDEQHPLVYKPEDLAAELGWVGKRGRFHWGHFESDVLKPAMDDMFGAADGSTSAKVRRFSGDYELRRAATRGRPVEAVIIRVGKAKKHLAETQKPPIDATERDRIREMFERAKLDTATEVPSEEILAQAAGKLKVDVILVAERWITTMSLAKEDPDILIGSLGILTGRQILTAMATEGIRDAFTRWLADWREPDGINYRHGHEPAVTPVTEVAEIDPEVEADDSEEGAELDTSTPLLLTLATGYRVSDAEAVLQGHTWSGKKPMTIRLVAPNADGSQREHSVEVTPTALDLGRLMRDHNHIITNLEYAA